MKHFLFCLLSFVFVLCSCKTQQFTMHDAGCTVIRDSVCVTYHPGTVLSLTDSTDSTDCAPTYGGAITVKPQHDGLTSQAQRCSSARPLQIPQKVRVDTLLVERWHTEEVPAPPKPIPRFYKRCTWGFFILLLLIIGRTAFRIFRLFYLRR